MTSGRISEIIDIKTRIPDPFNYFGIIWISPAAGDVEFQKHTLFKVYAMLSFIIFYNSLFIHPYANAIIDLYQLQFYVIERQGHAPFLLLLESGLDDE